MESSCHAPTILMVDDDVDLCELLIDYLSADGFHVHAVHDGASGLEAIRAGAIDAVILDVMLPGRMGLDVLRDARRSHDVPILMLTARGDDIDRILGLEMGADDYLPKPFNPRELAARLRALLRRSNHDPNGTRKALEIADLKLDFSARKITIGNINVALTSMEFEVLAVLLHHAGEVVSREELYRSALKRKATPFDRALDMHISHLRRKLGPDRHGEPRIATIRNSGYLYANHG